MAFKAIINRQSREKVIRPNVLTMRRNPKAAKTGLNASNVPIAPVRAIINPLARGN